MEIAGYIGALLMGLTLGLIGGGGSILTVPILVYLFGVDAVTATGYSLFLVGTTALFGAGSHMRNGNVHWPSVLWFGAPSIVAVFATRKWIVPALPEVWISSGTLTVTKGVGLLLLFALLMVAAAIGMIRKKKVVPVKKSKEMGPSDTPDLAVSATVSGLSRSGEALLIKNSVVILEGLVVGTLTGLVGAGGGFLIIPALVLFAGLSMKQAIGTSLVIIAAKSLIGFTGDLSHNPLMDWPFLLGFAGVAIVGILLGSALNKRVSNEQLRPAFGWFVLIMGILMIVKELYGA